MPIKHSVSKSPGDLLYAAEWNLDHLIDGPLILAGDFTRSNNDAIISIDNKSATNEFQAAGIKIETKSTVVDKTLGILGFNRGKGDFMYVELTGELAGQGGTCIACDVKDGASQAGEPAYAYQSKLCGYYDIGLHIYTDPNRTTTNIQQLVHLKPRLGAIALDIRSMAWPECPLIFLGANVYGSANKVKWCRLWETNKPFFVLFQAGSDKMRWTYGDDSLETEQEIMEIKKDNGLWVRSYGGVGTGIELYDGMEEQPVVKLERRGAISFGPGGTTAVDTLLLRRGAGQITGESDDNLELGTNTYRLHRVRAVSIVQGDIGFEETICPVCGLPFKEGDRLSLKVINVKTQSNKQESQTTCIPCHSRCLNEQPRQD